MAKQSKSGSLLKIIDMAAMVKYDPEDDLTSKPLLAEGSTRQKRTAYSKKAIRTEAILLWTTMLSGTLDKVQRKRLLELVPHHIAPWLSQPEVLMDFMSDSFGLGGSTALQALSGLFYLIQHRNLDYPHFYLKLYSLLDSFILHSKHTIRFLRLLSVFLSSTHLPSSLVASFLKRLSRLALYASPSTIVAVIPLLYNLLKLHPACTMMIHRKLSTLPGEDGLSAAGTWDVFRMDEPDPTRTEAHESSLWEIHSLQSHYHPNVATIARIISEQFTRENYNLDDFLDHSYATILDANLQKRLEKNPVIEFEVPANIFPNHHLLSELWGFED